MLLCYILFLYASLPILCTCNFVFEKIRSIKNTKQFTIVSPNVPDKRRDEKSKWKSHGHRSFYPHSHFLNTNVIGAGLAFVTALQTWVQLVFAPCQRFCCYNDIVAVEQFFSKCVHMQCMCISTSYLPLSIPFRCISCDKLTDVMESAIELQVS